MLVYMGCVMVDVLYGVVVLNLWCVFDWLVIFGYFGYVWFLLFVGVYYWM